MEDARQTALVEKHSHARHLFQLTVTWYTWFIALNYATLGWLTANGSTARPGVGNAQLWIVYLLFTSHNAMGVLWLRHMRSFISNLAAEPSIGPSLPAREYGRGLLLMGLTLWSLLVAWTAARIIW